MDPTFNPRSVWRDTRGQALTEFAIIIPIVLLFFLAILQYLQIFRASQHVNYAAFVAARTYSVHASVDGTEEATRLALDSAALALAPVAKPAPSEFLGLGSLSAGNSKLAKLLEGFLVARYIRLNPKIGGGSLTVTKGKFSRNSPVQVDVEIQYPQPIFIPGLAELWRLVGDGAEMGADLEALNDGLSGPIAVPDRILEAMPDELENVLPGIVEQTRTLLYRIVGHGVYPYVNVRGKCSLGYSDWGRKDGKAYAGYQPRLRAELKDSGRETAADLNRSFQKEGEELDRDYHTIRSVADSVRKACADQRAADAQLEKAQQNYDSSVRAAPDAKFKASEQLRAAQERADEASRETEMARAELRQILDRLGEMSDRAYKMPSCDP